MISLPSSAGFKFPTQPPRPDPARSSGPPSTRPSVSSSVPPPSEVRLRKDAGAHIVMRPKAPSWHPEAPTVEELSSEVLEDDLT